ncbi:hypothetical protein TcasGA2_TC034923, partial [Tribolium castaneum]
KSTKEQSSCSLWHEMRYGRTTVFKIYEATRCRTSEGSLTEGILGAAKFETEASTRGRRLEPLVVNDVAKMKNVKILQSGLI